MCGLFGMLTTNPCAYERDVLKGLAWLSNFRGDHSSGVAIGVEDTAADRKSRYHVYTTTRVGNSGALLDLDRVKNRIASPEVRCVIGHTRYATLGAVNQANAHPYHEGHVIGAHNGTMHAFKPATENLEKETDSRLFYRHLSEHGVDSAIDKAWHGAYALTWIDLNDSSINFLRNKDRPLWMALSKSHDSIFWSSEYTFLDMVNTRSDNRMEDIKILPENTLFSTSMSRIDFSKREVKKAPLITFPKNFGKKYGKGKRKFDDEGSDIHDYMAKSGTTDVIPFVPDKVQKKIEFKDGSFYRGFKGERLKPSDAAQRIKRGCTITGNIPDLTQSIWWYNSHNFVSNIVYYNKDAMDSFFPKERVLTLGGLYTTNKGIDTRIAYTAKDPTDADC